MTGEVKGDRGKKMEEIKKPKYKRWLWRGLWYWIFMLAVTFGMYALAIVYGAGSIILLARFKMAFGLVILIGVVGFVILTFVGSGWAQEEAAQRVK